MKSSSKGAVSSLPSCLAPSFSESGKVFCMGQRDSGDHQNCMVIVQDLLKYRPESTSQTMQILVKESKGDAKEKSFDRHLAESVVEKVSSHTADKRVSSAGSEKPIYAP